MMGVAACARRLYLLETGPTPGGDMSPTWSFVQMVWAQRIGGRKKWSEGIRELYSFYQTYGTGVIGRNSMLLWRDGALKAAPAWKIDDGMKGEGAAHVAGLGVAHFAEWDLLQANTMEHLEGQQAHHTLVCGEAGAGQAALLREVVTSELVMEMGLRVVMLDAADMSSLNSLGAWLQRCPRARFVVVVEGPLSSSMYRERVMEMLPPNSLLYAFSEVADAKLPQGLHDTAIGHFGLAVHLKSFRKDTFMAVVRELAVWTDPPIPTETPEDFEAELIEAAQEEIAAEGKYSVRSAAQYVNLCRMQRIAFYNGEHIE